MKPRHSYQVAAIAFLCVFLLQYSSAELDPSSAYCFRFTWLGPQYDNTTTAFNTTCTEYLDSIRAVGVPCRQPFVITHNATPPDIDYIWENYATQATCRRTKGSVCAKYSYTFNNEVQNTTYMCTQAYVVNEGPLTSGCYTQTVDGHKVQVCLCESVAGYMPCNGSDSLQVSLVVLVLLGMMKLVMNTFGSYY